MTASRLLYGGTFDPVHLGHLQVALAVARRLRAPVALVPAADPPHRPAPGASAEQRAQMLELAIAGLPMLRVDRRELARDRPSYTVDTLGELRREAGPRAPLVWIVGIDSLLGLSTWHHWRRLLSLGHLLGVQRPRTAVDAAWLRARAPRVAAELAGRWTRPEDLLRTPAGGYAPLPLQPLRRESATEVRRRIAQGGDWRALVPGTVASFIAATGLYGAGDGTAVILAPRQAPPSEDTR